ncbi:hypothetical protein FT688_08005 [Aeromonas hydrophila]|nr:hypothetical protein FT688_08005 [Aeromonas hydrophila]
MIFSLHWGQFINTGMVFAMYMKKSFLFSLVCLGLYGCNGGSDNSKTLAEQFKYDPITQATENDIHSSTFISALKLIGLDTKKIKSISFKIKTKDGHYAKPVSAIYDWSYLSTNNLYDDVNNTVTIPIFGLYSDYLNEITIEISFIDSSSYLFQKSVLTAPYIDSVGIYDNIGINIRPNKSPSYSYFYLKGQLKSPS